MDVIAQAIPPKIQAMKTTILIPATLLGFFLISCSKSNDADWQDLQTQATAQPLKVGMDYQGGIVAYLDETGKHGLIVAREEFGPAAWGCSGTEVPGARDMVNGKANTVAIQASCPGNGAALCAGFIATDRAGMFARTYSDWHLPAFSELVEICMRSRTRAICAEKPTGHLPKPPAVSRR